MARNNLQDGRLSVMSASEESALLETQQNSPPLRRHVAKTLIVQRLIAANLIDEAYAALSASPEQFARWFMADRTTVYADDDEVITFLNAIGADADAILAP